MVVVPWFLIPGRPYPIQTYLYACSFYSENPDIGQRGAAKATRAKFKLESFSHSTVSRTFRAFEQTREQGLERRFGEEMKASDAGSLANTSAVSNIGAKSDEAYTARHFPSVRDTAARRGGMAGFFRKFLYDAEGGDIIVASQRFVKDWYIKTQRLLL